MLLINSSYTIFGKWITLISDSTVVICIKLFSCHKHSFWKNENRELKLFALWSIHLLSFWTNALVYNASFLLYTESPITLTKSSFKYFPFSFLFKWNWQLNLSYIWNLIVKSCSDSRKSIRCIQFTVLYLTQCIQM